MNTEQLSLSVSDGSQMNAYVSRPVDKPRAGVIVFQEAFGVNDYIQRTTDKLAAEGYLAIAPELFHRTAPGFSPVEAPLEEVMQHIQALTEEGIEADARATFDWLKGELGSENIGIIGFCMGGRSAYIANSILPFKAAVSFYGGGIDGMLDRVPKLAAPMLFIWGGADPRITRDIWTKIPAALDAAGKRHVQAEFSGAQHAFMTDDRASYHAQSAELAWPLMTSFLAQNLSNES